MTRQEELEIWRARRRVLKALRDRSVARTVEAVAQAARLTAREVEVHLIVLRMHGTIGMP